MIQENFDLTHDENMEELAIFVYGTLKSGEERADRWPHPPQKVQRGVVCAALYDLGPYPALTEGNDNVLGELWEIAAEHMQTTLTVLDRIECFGVDEVDLYVRKTVPVRLEDGSIRSAHAYFIADANAVKGYRRVAPNQDGVAVWSRRQTE